MPHLETLPTPKVRETSQEKKDKYQLPFLELKEQVENFNWKEDNDQFNKSKESNSTVHH